MSKYLAIGYTGAEIVELKDTLNLVGPIDVIDSIQEIPIFFNFNYGTDKETIAQFTYFGDEEINEAQSLTTFNKIKNTPDYIKIPIKNTDIGLYFDLIAGLNDGSKTLYKYDKFEDTDKINLRLIDYAINSPKKDIESDIYSGKISWNPLAENAIRSSVKEISEVILNITEHNVSDYPILDIGCGGGGLAISLASLGYEVYGCDPSQSINFAYLKRYVAMTFDSVDEYASKLYFNIPKTISGNTMFQESKAIKELPLKKTPLFFQADFETLRPHIGEKIPIPDIITMSYVLKYINEEKRFDFLSDVSNCLRPNGKILIVDDEITIDSENLPLGVTISDVGEFKINNNGFIDKYFVLEKK